MLSIGALSANTTNGIRSNDENVGVDGALYSSVTCDEVLKSCDKALEDSRKEVEILQGLNKIRREEIERLRYNDDTWVRSRALWLGLGVLAGLAGGVYLAK